MKCDTKTLKEMANWLLPPEIFRLLSYYRPSAVLFFLRHRHVLAHHRSLHNRHEGARCFILCNGPSVNAQNIRPLKNEIVFSVSSGYLHPDYAEIAPRYHCVPQISYLPGIDAALIVKWFGEMDQKIGAAELFLDCQEWALVQKNGLFGGRATRFLCMGKNHFPKEAGETPDLSGVIPRVQSAPLMALMIALSMGFKEIYLLGTDHDWFVKKEYRYSFGHTIFRGKDQGVDADGVVESKLYDDLPMITRLWGQYRAIGKLADHLGVRIYNATQGGMLDEFPRVRLEEVIGQ